MIILDIVLSVLAIVAFILLSILHGKVTKLKLELEKNRERNKIIFEDMYKKIRIISNKKW